MSTARNRAKALAAAQQPTTAADASAPIMHVAAQEVPAQDAAPVELPTPDQDATQAPEVEQASPLTVATDDAPAAPVAAQPAPAPLAPFTPELPARAPRSMEELFELVNRGKGLTERLTGLRGTAEKLSSFSVGREGYTDRLTLRDGNGLEWNTTQGVVIQKVLNVLRAELRDSIEGTEAQLRELLAAA